MNHSASISIIVASQFWDTIEFLNTCIKYFYTQYDCIFNIIYYITQFSVTSPSRLLVHLSIFLIFIHIFFYFPRQNSPLNFPAIFIWPQCSPVAWPSLTHPKSLNLNPLTTLLMAPQCLALELSLSSWNSPEIFRLPLPIPPPAEFLPLCNPKTAPMATFRRHFPKFPPLEAEHLSKSSPRAC